MAGILLILLIVGAIVLSKKRKATRLAAKTEEAQRNLVTAGGEAFVPEVKAVMGKGRYGLAIDPRSEHFAVMTPGGARVFAYSQLVAVEPLFDGQSNMGAGNSATGAIVGGALFGAAGAVGGAIIGGKRRVARLSLKFWTDDLVEPTTEVVFFEYGSRVPVTHKWLRDVLPDMETWYARFRVIQERNPRNMRVVGTA